MVMSGDSSRSMKQQANTIILEFSGASSDDIRDLRHGQGKVFKRIARTIEALKEQGEVGENVQPIIAVVNKKKSRKGRLD